MLTALYLGVFGQYMEYLGCLGSRILQRNIRNFWKLIRSSMCR